MKLSFGFPGWILQVNFSDRSYSIVNKLSFRKWQMQQIHTVKFEGRFKVNIREFSSQLHQSTSTISSVLKPLKPLPNLVCVAPSSSLSRLFDHFWVLCHHLSWLCGSMILWKNTQNFWVCFFLISNHYFVPFSSFVCLFSYLYMFLLLQCSL